MRVVSLVPTNPLRAARDRAERVKRQIRNMKRQPPNRKPLRIAHTKDATRD